MLYVFIIDLKGMLFKVTGAVGQVDTDHLTCFISIIILGKKENFGC